MINARQIDRMVQREQYGLLTRRILANGRQHEQWLLAGLGPGDWKIAALGLALRRLDELSPGENAVGDRIAAMLSDALQAAHAVTERAAAIAGTGLQRWRIHRAEVSAAGAA